MKDTGKKFISKDNKYAFCCMPVAINDYPVVCLSESCLLVKSSNCYCIFNNFLNKIYEDKEYINTRNTK